MMLQLGVGVVGARELARHAITGSSAVGTITRSSITRCGCPHSNLFTNKTRCETLPALSMRPMPNQRPSA
jgi:hypothetical protein